MSTDNKKTKQMFLDGAIQGGVVLGEMWIANKLKITHKSKPVKSLVLVATVVASDFVKT